MQLRMVGIDAGSKTTVLYKLKCDEITDHHSNNWNFFMAVLPREGRMYTFSWGNDGKLGHLTEPTDVEPHPLLGALENVPVVKIAAGYCYLLALACQPNGIWK
ncbi:uncharacterized protein LOC125471435 isoform X4 [Pyrus x bretschneideri]|nr:uncharacterized protein LOC125471435 isoform X4 [Pyrus x bretschneideri]